MNETPKAPKHLRPATKRWFASVVASFEMDEHHVKLLILAASAWDECEAARAAIQKYGMTFEDRFGSPHARPEIAIQRDARLAFARMLRELGLDVAPPVEAPRPHLLPAERGRKAS